MNVDVIFQIVILIISVIIHEVSHGYVANLLGDPTAKYEGRLTLNPIPHIDPLGSIILPFLLIISGSSFVIGWAKPVPFNPYNLKNQRWGEAMVAAAGPIVNILIALVFGLALRFLLAGDVLISVEVVRILGMIVLINLLLAVFNLIPIPPLDGSKILFSILPRSFEAIRNTLETYGLIIVIIFAFFLWQYIAPVVINLFVLITGVYF
jgi:Zn-dependent protease